MSNQPSDSLEPSRTLSRYMLLLASFCGGLLLVALIFKRVPSVPPDEFGFLINGQRLLGHREVPINVDMRSFYMAGYGLFTALAAFLGRNMRTQFTISLLFNIMFVACTTYVLYLLANKHLALSKSWSRIIAIAATVIPGVAAISLFSWSESLNRLTFALLILLFFEYGKRPSIKVAAPIGVLAGFMPIAHGRFTLLLPLVAFMFVVTAVTKDSSCRISALIGVGSSVLAAMAFRAINMWLKRDLYPGSIGQEGRILKKVYDFAYYPEYLRAVLTQSWYLVTTSFGVSALGVIALVIFIARTVKQKQPLSWLGPVFTLFACLTIFFTCVLQLWVVVRPDHLAYGRYSEVFAPVLLVIGFTFIIQHGITAIKYWAFGFGSVFVILGILMLGLDGDNLHQRMARGEYFEIGNGIALDVPRSLLAPMGYLSITALCVAIGVLLMVIARKNKEMAIAMFATIGLACTTFTVTHSIMPRREYVNHITMDGAINALSKGDKTLVGFDAANDVGHNYYVFRYLLDPVQMTRIKITDAAPQGMSCIVGVSERPPVGNWEQADVDNKLGLVLWKLAGVDYC